MTEYRKLIAIDFDGVLHLYAQSWTDAATISDGPTPGAMAFLRDLVEDGRFEVVIVSSRLSSDDGEQAVLVWLDRELAATFGHEVGGRVQDAVRLSATRPPAFLTIDDRAWTFNGMWPDLDAIAAFRPWNKGGRPDLRNRIDRIEARLAEISGRMEEVARRAFERGVGYYDFAEEECQREIQTILDDVLKRQVPPQEYDAEAVRIASEGLTARRYPPATAVDD